MLKQKKKNKLCCPLIFYVCETLEKSPKRGVPESVAILNSVFKGGGGGSEGLIGSTILFRL